MTATAYDKVWEPPRPGAWEIDLTHWPRPMSRFVVEGFASHFQRGFADGSKMYGLLLETMDFAPINGFMYNAPRPVGAPLDAKGPPPKPIFKLLTWFHPEIRRRIRTSSEAIAARSWLKDLAHWDREAKPQAIAENMALQKVDLRSLDDGALLEHLRAAFTNYQNGAYRHGRFTMTACVPVGDYLAHVNRWTGEPTHALMRVLRGHSAVSRGIAAPEFDTLVALLRKDPVAAKQLDAKVSSDALTALQSVPGDIGAATKAWLEAVGHHMVTGYDVCDFAALEMPDILIGGLRAALSPQAGGDGQAATEREVSALRQRVPEAERALFDTLLSDVRAVYRLRDERDHYNDGWSTGLMRRALLETGRRLVEKGRLSSATLITDASMDEVIALLQGAGPSADELRARAQWRMTADGAKVPQRLGLPPSKPPPAEWLPPPAARMARAIDTFLFGLFQPSESESSASVVRGIPVSPGTYEGPARVVSGPEDFDLVRQGDVLVTRSTSPYFNVLLPLLGAIVTDRGGALSHAAIVAREYGIPGVVGTKTATVAIRTGQRVHVDGGTGEVQVIGA